MRFMMRAAIVLVLAGLLATGVGCDRSSGPSKSRRAKPRRTALGSHHVRIVKLKLRDRTSSNDQVVRLSSNEMRRILVFESPDATADTARGYLTEAALPLTTRLSPAGR